MSLLVKICGITDTEGLNAAALGGADMIGFIFCEKGVSKCYMAPEEVAALLKSCARPASFPKIVGVLRNQTDEEILKILAHVPVDYLQLHGDETPQRVAEIRALTGRQVIKVFRVAAAQDLAHVSDYDAVADFYLFDTLTNGPTNGGTGKSFDWNILKGRSFARPWLLAGGINADNLRQALAVTGAKMVDVSSGVEKPAVNGRRYKDPDKVRAFLKLAKDF
jgi:phosphoribosylanthranilate isomerase